jgi:predicted TIM-barrel fold metal-dependent hydrolase
VFADDLLGPWFDQTMRLLPTAAIFDAHTHIGVNDPDTFKITAQELLAALAAGRSRAVVFPMHEPGGYPPANDYVIATAAASEGRLVAFCRIDPRTNPIAEIRRCLAAGARGIKLHPRAENFAMDEPAVRKIVAEADASRLPILIHAGRGIPALGAHVLEYAARFPHARFILAHAGVCDLAWIWERVAEHPNVFFDTSWFSAPDLLMLFSHVPPGRVLYATDLPFGTPQQSVVVVFRCALQAGLDADALASVAGGQIERLLAREDALELGPALGSQNLRSDPLLARAAYFITCAFAAALARGSSTEFIELARLACQVGPDAPQARACRSIQQLLDLALQTPMGEMPMERFAHIHLLVVAAAIAVTPDVAVP